ncbi:hypothetical protein ACM1PE_06825 [Achromobacter sp. PD1]|uniref:hypothetical protein n=1 Tax=Achromobacter sp. PD1 TaxID=3399125 RepID=UPI003AF54EB2
MSIYVLPQPSPAFQAIGLQQSVRTERDRPNAVKDWPEGCTSSYGAAMFHNFKYWAPYLLVLFGVLFLLIGW